MTINLYLLRVSYKKQAWDDLSLSLSHSMIITVLTTYRDKFCASNEEVIEVPVFLQSGKSKNKAEI